MADKEKDLQEFEEEEEEVVTLVDEDGKEIDFYELAVLDYKNKWYTILEPVEPIDGLEEGDVLIYEISEEEDGKDTLLPVEDEDTWHGVLDEFEKMLEEDEDAE